MIGNDARSFATLVLISFLFSHSALARRPHPSSFIIPHSSFSRMARIPAGFYRPFYKTKGIDSVRVEAFYMDVAPVTNENFLQFVKANPEWARSRVSPALAGPGYLKRWKRDFEIGDPSLNNAPVVNVSWFAARAYARWRHKRLPTIAEWEYAAKAPILKPRRASGAEERQLIIDWYGKQNPSRLQTSGTVEENAYGLWDLFGQVWEWTEDFNSVVIPNACGAAGSGVRDPTDYPAFMRFGMRNSLKANDVSDQLGFRCVK